MSDDGAPGTTAERDAFAALAGEERLGGAVRFETSTPATGRRVFSAVFLLAMSVLLGLVAVNAGDDVAVMVVFAVGAAILLWLLAGVVRALVQGGRASLGIYEGGFIHRSAGGPVTVVRWGDVRTITRSATTMVVDGQQRHTSVRVVIDGAHGRTQLTEEFAGVLDLSELMERRVCESLLPEALALLRAGTPVGFGPLTVDKSGIGSGPARLSWQDVGQVVVHAGRVTVSQRVGDRTWATVPLRRLPNLSLLVHLVDLGRQRAL